MPDITVPMDLFIALAPALGDINTLKPPALPKGRYVLQKALDQCETPFTAFQKWEQAFIKRVAVCDAESGEPILKPLGNGFHFDYNPDVKAEAEAERAEKFATPVVLAGLRMITHAELGNCPITGAQERLLIKVGLLEDSEPT